jgi:hypothetical protein
MSTSIFAVLIVVLILLVIGNLVFSFIAERRNPPVGKFIECDGVRVHYREWGDAMAPCVVLFHGNGTMIQDFAISGLVDLLARRNRVLCFDRPGFGYTQRPRERDLDSNRPGRPLCKSFGTDRGSGPCGGRTFLGHIGRSGPWSPWRLRGSQSGARFGILLSNVAA